MNNLPTVKEVLWWLKGTLKVNLHHFLKIYAIRSCTFKWAVWSWLLEDINIIDSMYKLNDDEPAHKIMVLIANSNSKGSDEPLQMHKFTRAFSVHMHDIWK